MVEPALGALYEFDDEVFRDFDLLELGDLLGVAEALSHCFEPDGQVEDPHVDEEVVGEADLDSGFAEGHWTSPLVMSVSAFDDLIALRPVSESLNSWIKNHQVPHRRAPVVGHARMRVHLLFQALYLNIRTTIARMLRTGQQLPFTT